MYFRALVCVCVCFVGGQRNIRSFEGIPIVSFNPCVQLIQRSRDVMKNARVDIGTPTTSIVAISNPQLNLHVRRRSTHKLQQLDKWMDRQTDRWMDRQTDRYASSS
jgi:hypothetical protein